MSEISSLRNDILQIKMGLKLLTACCSFANCCAMYSGLYQPVCQWFYQFFFFYKINNRAQTAVFVKLFNHISKATISLLLQWTSRKVEISFLKSLFKFLGNPFSSCALSSWSYWPVRFFVKMQYVINFSGLCRCWFSYAEDTFLKAIFQYIFCVFFVKNSCKYGRLLVLGGDLFYVLDVSNWHFRLPSPQMLKP